jgi:hypothetical protein
LGLTWFAVGAGVACAGVACAAVPVVVHLVGSNLCRWLVEKRIGAERKSGQRTDLMVMDGWLVVVDCS